jgi:hypothetical protein
MAHNIRDNRNFHQSQHVDKFSFRYLSPDVRDSRRIRMAQIKIGLIWICDILGISSTILGWVSNIDNVRSAVLFILGTIYLGGRIYYSFRKWDLQIRKELWEQKEREKQK